MLSGLCAVGPVSTPSLPGPEEPAHVLIVGTFHMAAQRDPLNPTVEDLLGETRQAEIQELVERLADFEPTRIAGKIVRLAQPGERVLVLFGANHRKILIELLGQVEGIELADAQAYLDSD